MSTTYELVCIPCKKRLWVGQSGWHQEKDLTSCMDTMYIYGTDEHVQALGWFFHDHFDHELRFVSSYAFNPEDGGNLEDFTEFKVPKGPVPRL